jgi:CDP-diacylglycerol---glycerol-3-phosphate 3-phosphatidyltransferase
MTTANKLTLLRVAIIPIMIVVLFIEPLNDAGGFFGSKLSQTIFALLFVLAAFTDFLDGYIARKYQQVTTFGKFLDPIADKMLVITALLFLMLLDASRVPIWAVMIIIAREFMVTGIRLLAVEKGKVIAASQMGRFKTATTMLALVILLFNDFNLTPWIGNIIFYVAILLTLISGIDYFIKNKQIIFESI